MALKFSLCEWMGGRNAVCRIHIYAMHMECVRPTPFLSLYAYFHLIFFWSVSFSPFYVYTYMNGIRTKQIQSDGDTNMRRRLRQYAYDNAINRVFRVFFLIHGDRSDVLHNVHVSFHSEQCIYSAPTATHRHIYTDSTSFVQLIDSASGKYFLIRAQVGVPRKHC